ncbi:UNVERIFIED_CONTAM: hypothetical protein GTU68_009706 [Idotea baltica]|nr:hypothetical protein [Idotea baltica]
MSWGQDNQLSIVALGQGSNVVLAGELNALILHQKSKNIELLEQDTQSVLIKVQAGKDWHGLVRWCLQRDYFGLENLALIPGTVGAAPIQNIGAYGVELSSFVYRVHAIAVADGSSVILHAADCLFGYRDSIFKQALRDQLVITAVELAYPALRQSLSHIPSAQLTPQMVFDAVVEIRQSKLPNPRLTPNAGSFFKNPILSAAEFKALLTKAEDVPHHLQIDGTIKVPAAWLIEKCGWKGRRIGNVGVHPEHSLVIVNYGERDGQVLLILAEQVRADVLANYGVNLEIEPRVYG